DAFRRGRDLALANDDPGQAVWNEASRALALAYGGHHEAALSASQAALAIADRAGSPSARSLAHPAYAETLLHPDPNAARTHLAVAAELARSVDSPYLLTLA